MREKWEEIVRYTEASKPDFGEKKVLSMFNGRNGDLYVSIHDIGTNLGKTIRIERSGGAIAENPRLVKALTLAYDAIADNPDLLKKETTKLKFYKEDNVEYLRCKCLYKIRYSKDISLKDRDIFYCPKCGKEIEDEN